MAEAKAEEKPTPKQVLRYASETLLAVRPQPPPEQIAAAMGALKGALLAIPDKDEPKPEEPPKDVQDALGKIEAKIGKLDPAPKDKIDLSQYFTKAEAPKEEHHAEPAHASGKASKSA